MYFSRLCSWWSYFQVQYFLLEKIQRNVEPDLDQGEDGSHMGSQRLKDIECELGEQKKSTAKITKLCLAAIKVF